MKSNEMYLVKLRYFISEETSQFLVNGINELAKLSNLLKTSERYRLESIDKLGKIDNCNDLIQDLIDEQRPDDLDCSVTFVSGKEK